MKRLIILFGILVSLSATLLASSPAYATDPLANTCSGAVAATSSVCQSRGNGHSNPIIGPSGVLTKTTSIIAFIAGATAAIVVLVGAVMYVTSGGDTGKLNTARDMIIYSLVGLVIIVLARSIIVFIIDRI